MYLIYFNVCVWFIFDEVFFIIILMLSIFFLSCMFEIGIKCFLKDVGFDDFDWIVRSVWFIIYDIVLKC